MESNKDRVLWRSMTFNPCRHDIWEWLTKKNHWSDSPSSGLSAIVRSTNSTFSQSENRFLSICFAFVYFLHYFSHVDHWLYSSYSKVITKIGNRSKETIRPNFGSVQIQKQKSSNLSKVIDQKIVEVNQMSTTSITSEKNANVFISHSYARFIKMLCHFCLLFLLTEESDILFSPCLLLAQGFWSQWEKQQLQAVLLQSNMLEKVLPYAASTKDSSYNDANLRINSPSFEFLCFYFCHNGIGGVRLKWLE